MGRGRAKAKQTKVARALKYSTSGTDLERLQAELRASEGAPADDAPDELDDELDPLYSKYLDDDEDEDEEASSS